MKSITSGMQNLLTQAYCPLWTLILITRQDGLVYAFTDCDIPINYNGNVYEPAISMSPSGVRVNADLTTDQMDVIGAIDSIYITEQDIEGGRFDLAQIVVMRVNPFNLAFASIVELTGTIGQIDYGDGNLQAPINSLGSYLNQQFGDLVTPSCRVRQLGDVQCKVNIASYQFGATVQSWSSDNRTLVFNSTQVTGYFDFGMVRFANKTGGGGNNYSINAEVKTSIQLGSGQMQILLQEPMPFSLAVGDVVVLEAGCNRSGAQCRQKFNNLVNFHGDPYVPGNDYLLTVAIPPSGG